MLGQRANSRATAGFILFVVACAWVLSGLGAAAAWSDAHNSRFAHVQATLSRCGSNGCEANFQLHGRVYTVTGATGSDGQRVTLYVNPDQPYTYAQAQSWLRADGPFLLVVLLTLLGTAAWWVRQRLAASRS